MSDNPILNIVDLSVIDTLNQHPLINHLSMAIYPHRSLAIVGESGSGKSLLAKAIVGLLPSSLSAQGDIFFHDKRLSDLSAKQWQQMRGRKISLVVQNAMSAFDPLMTIGHQFDETLNTHFSLSAVQRQQRIMASLDKVKLLQVHNLLNSYPHQLSGGQLQRVMIAIALALEPDIIIADEPTTALDAITQFEVMQAFTALIDENKATLIFITHDLGLVKGIADDIAVMKNGEIIEFNNKAALLSAPKHPYTQFLLATRQKLTERFDKIRGNHVIKC